MPKISKEESNKRRDAVIDACAALYDHESFHDITMTQIAEGVPFGRANVYNYFHSKNEVLLALLQREYADWTADLDALAGSVAPDDDEALAQGLAESLSERDRMLKILAMNLFDIEQDSRLELLVEFKQVYKATTEALDRVLAAAKPGWGQKRRDAFSFSFLPFTHGVYPYVFHSDKQVEAMKRAHMTQPDLTVAGMVRATVMQLLA